MAPLQERRGRAAGAHGAPCNIARPHIYVRERPFSVICESSLLKFVDQPHEYIRILAPKHPKLAFSHRKNVYCQR